MRPLVVVGDVMVDHHLHVDPAPADEKVRVLTRERQLGGTGANVAAAMAALGASPMLVAAVGDDADGEWLRTQLAERALRDDGIVVLPGRTGNATIIHRGERREVLVDIGVALDVPAPSLAGLDESLVFANFAPRVAVELVLRGDGPRTVVGFEAWMADVPGLLDALDGVALVITNAAGGEALDAAGRSPVAPWVVTDGARGVTIREPGEAPVRVPAVEVEALDATGAGDCFAGVLVACLAEGVGLREAVEHAVRGAALSTTVVGAQGLLPTREQVGLPPARR